MPFGSDLCRMGFSADQAADVMRTVRSDQRELFLRNFETLISLPLPFDQAMRAAIWSMQDDWAAITGTRLPRLSPWPGPIGGAGESVFRNYSFSWINVPRAPRASSSAGAMCRAPRPGPAAAPGAVCGPGATPDCHRNSHRTIEYEAG